MTKQKTHIYRFETLLPLKMVLTKAGRDLPPRVVKKDVNEELALKLIEKMKKEYKRPLSIIS